MSGPGNINQGMDVQLYIRNEQLARLEQQLPANLIANIICIVSFAVVFYTDIALPTLVSWLIFSQLINLFGVYLIYAARSRNLTNNPQRCIDMYYLYAVGDAITFATAAWLFFDPTSSAHNIFLITVLLGISAGGQTTLLSHIPSATSFTALIVLSLALRMAIAGGDNYLLLSALSLVFGAVLLRIAFGFNTSLILGWKMRYKLENELEERKRAINELRKNEERLTIAGEASYDLIYEWDTDSDDLVWFGDINSLLGYEEGHISQTIESWLQLIHPSDITKIQNAVELHRNSIVAFKYEYRVRHGDGRYRYWHDHATPLLDESGQPYKWLGVCTDITERKQAEAKLQLAASVFSHAREGIMITASDGTIIEVNDSFLRITGYNREEVIGNNPRILNSGQQSPEFYANIWRSLAEEGHWSGEIWNRRKNGEIYAEMLTISAVCDAGNKAQYYISLFSDITMQKEHEKQLEHIAHYDALTNLPNRVLLADRLQQAMVRAQRNGLKMAAIYIDLDGFKVINDTHGHEVGDRLLLTISARMQEALRDCDTIARLGGDEFVAVLSDLEDSNESMPILDRLLSSAAKAVQIDELTLQVSASLGVSFYPQAEEVDAEQILRQSDQAMYQAKVSGKNRHHVFDPDHDRYIRGYHESLERIRQALTDSEFVLHYQPKVNMRNGTVVGVEALIRWQHPERGLLPPIMFLPVIENHPLAIELGEWVIDTALTQIETWNESGLHIPVSVNVSAIQLQQSEFLERLGELLTAHPGVRPGQLELEVLESSALEDISHVSRVMHACQELDVSFSLDDFGTGYSSLTYLKRLPTSRLKIDQSFVRDMLDDAEDLAILNGILNLATSFRRQVIAEGVESVAHGELLIQLGCELAQGYAIAKPMPAVMLPSWVETWTPNTNWTQQKTVKPADLPLLFAGIEHRAWIKATEEFFRGERSTPPSLDHSECNFGVWLYGEGRERHGNKPSFKIIETLHHSAHEMVKKMLNQHQQDNSAVQTGWLEELHALRDNLLGELDGLMQFTPSNCNNT